ncbi:MAG TPA: peptidylprolyl isomerase [Acidimicrobiales bacterium]
MPSEKRARQRALRDQKLAVQERHNRRARNTRRSVTLVIAIGVIIALVALLSSGGSKKPTAAKSTTTTAAVTTTTATTLPVSKTAIAPVCPPATAAGAAKRVIAFTTAPPVCVAANSVFNATVVTDVGTFVIHMTTASSPAAVNNFVFLARYHFYNGIIFQRVIPNFIVQGGDPTGTGAGGPGYSFTGNKPPASCVAKGDCYATGDVALANSNSELSTDSSQFFIVVPGGASNLADSYTVLGQVTSGMNVVEKIAADGNSVAADGGVPPKVTHHMISVTVQQISA